ncbi:MAG: RNA recognition motif domain-containing protein [Spirochaetota bacterium]
MSNRVYVGNVNFRTTEEGLRDLFAGHGEVVSVRMITDRETGRFRGFSFVEMASEEQANAAVEALNGMELDGRPLKVNIAHERQPRTSDRY